MKASVLMLYVAMTLSSGCATLSSGVDGGNEIENAVIARIAQEPRIGVSELRVREEDGVVSIGGFLSSLEQMRLLDQIIDDVEDYDGVTRVENNVATTSRS